MAAAKTVRTNVWREAPPDFSVNLKDAVKPTDLNIAHTALQYFSEPPLSHTYMMV